MKRIMVLRAAFCAFALGGGCALLGFPAGVRASTPREFGLDVSHWQGASGISQSSWDQMFADGKRFAFIKATEGLTGPDDAAMANNVARAIAAGLLVGVYHFPHAENRSTTNGAIEEADHFLSYTGSAIGPGRLRPVLDLEGNSLSLSKVMLTDWVIAFHNRIAEKRGLGAAPIIYTGRSSAANELDSRVANYDLWLAYPTNVDASVSAPPPTTSYPDPTGVFNNWAFWQYSWTGSSGGISPLDLDVCHSEYKPLASYIIPAPSAPFVIRSLSLGGGGLHFMFTNTAGTRFTILASTNLALSLNGWTELGAATEGPPGSFQFTDPAANNSAQRFYRVRSP